MAKSIKNSWVGMVPLAAEPVFHIGNFPVTNSMINAWIVTAFLVVVALIASHRKTLVPQGIHNFFEAIVEFLFTEMTKVTESVQKTKKFFPFVATLFFFILLNNWLGLVPGTGTIGIYGMMHGEVELIPLLRPATSDLNLTLAIAALSIAYSHFTGVRAIGAVEHVSKFINVRGIWRALRKGPMAVAVAIIEFFVGILEIVSEVAKTVSLSLRLFGNVFAGEVLMGVMLGLVSYVVPIPFVFLELLVGVIQATVFAMLTLVFLTVATTSHGHEDEEHHDEHGDAKQHAHA